MKLTHALVAVALAAGCCAHAQQAINVNLCPNPGFEETMPVQGNGNTIVNKGPEAPVQHFWWWIGYPPDYALVLEMGSEAHQWGAGFGSGALQWELGRWYHVAAVFDSDGAKSTVTHYRDGEVVGAATRDEAFHCGAYDIKIGDYGGKIGRAHV